MATNLIILDVGNNLLHLCGSPSHESVYPIRVVLLQLGFNSKDTRRGEGQKLVRKEQCSRSTVWCKKIPSKTCFLYLDNTHLMKTYIRLFEHFGWIFFSDLRDYFVSIIQEGVFPKGSTSTLLKGTTVSTGNHTHTIPGYSYATRYTRWRVKYIVPSSNRYGTGWHATESAGTFTLASRFINPE